MTRFPLALALFVSLSFTGLSITSLPIAAEPSVDSAGGMTAEQLVAFIRQIDESAEGDNNLWRFNVGRRELFLVYDVAANRMRIMTPVVPSENLSGELQQQMLQANFDSVLDARYAIANDFVWSLYVHPLSALTPAQLKSAIQQVVTAANSFGTDFTSGTMIYQGGDGIGE